MKFSEWFRRLGWLGLVWLAHCAPIEEEGPAPAAPPVDRESWGTTFELHQSGMKVTLRAAYVADDLSRQTAYADSGVQIFFQNDAEELRTQAQSRRLTLEHHSDRIALGGEVLLSAGDSLEVHADTLIWEGGQEILWVPGPLRLVTSSGWERGRELRTGSDFAEWSMEEVVGHWHGSEEEGDYEVVIRARRESGRRDGGVSAAYDSVEVEYEGALVRSARARFSEAGGTLLFLDGVNGADSSREFTAREARFALGEQRLEARGDVAFVERGEEGRGFRLLADEMEEDRSAGQISARGKPAVFAQEGRRIEAGRLEYARPQERLEAEGQVLFLEGDRRLEASQLTYARQSERLHAVGGTELRAPEFEGTLSCGRLTYELQDGSGVLEEDPVLRRGDLEMLAKVMRFNLDARSLEGEGDFILLADGLQLRAGLGQYQADEEQLVLSGRPVLEKEQGEDGWHCRLIADSMVVQMEEGSVNRIGLPGGVEGAIESSERRTSWIEGAEGQLSFSGDSLEQLDLERDAEVTYRDLEREEVSHFQGDKIALYFTEEGLERAWVGGGARLLSRMPEGDREVSVNQVEGEELEIFFEEGAIVQVEIGPQVEGNYLPQDEK